MSQIEYFPDIKVFRIQSEAVILTHLMEERLTSLVLRNSGSFLLVTPANSVSFIWPDSGLRFATFSHAMTYKRARYSGLISHPSRRDVAIDVTRSGAGCARQRMLRLITESRSNDLGCPPFVRAGLSLGSRLILRAKSSVSPHMYGNGSALAQPSP